MKLQRSQLGSTGLDIPPIVFGTTSLGNLYTALPAKTQREVVAAWFKHVESPVAVDSAGKYGAGLALENTARQLRSLGIRPDQVVISNKLGWVRVPLKSPEPTFEPGVWVELEHDAVQTISYEGIMECYEQGCELLGEYRAQLVSVHDPDEYLAAAIDEADRETRWHDITEAYRALAELKRDGHVIGVGVGAKDWQTVRDINARVELDWVMIANSLTVHSHPRELVQFVRQLAEKSVGIINSAVFNGGFLVGGDFYNYRHVDATTNKGADLLHWRERFWEICRRFDVAPAEVCVAFGRSLPAINAIALSSTRPERVADNVRLVGKSMPEGLWQVLRKEELIDAEFPISDTQTR